MNKLIRREMANAAGLDPARSEVVGELVDVWQRHLDKNILREEYYRANIPVKDLGVTVTPQIAKKLDPRVDWAAKCVDWWADRVQFQGYTSDDDELKGELDTICRLNDFTNLVHKVVSSALKCSPAFITTTEGREDEPAVVVSGYPATASSAIWSDAKKRIEVGMVVVDSKWNRSHTAKNPTLAYVFTDTEVYILTKTDAGWVAEVSEHGLGRVPMEPVAYHQTLERPFGRSRITKPVRTLVDEAQRELMNMDATAAFAAAPQKYLLGADKAAAEKVADSPFGAFVGSIFTTTPNKNGQTPTYGQLPQLSMQPHSDYMRLLASMFSDATNVPLSSLGFSSTNPSSADAIIASKEDAIVDINSFIESCRRSLSNVAALAVAASRDTTFKDVMAEDAIGVMFADPATPSPVSMSDAVQKRVAAFPWMADSDVPLRDLGYSGETLHELQNDRRRYNASDFLGSALESE